MPQRGHRHAGGRVHRRPTERAGQRINGKRGVVILVGARAADPGDEVVGALGFDAHCSFGSLRVAWRAVASRFLNAR